MVQARQTGRRVEIALPGALCDKLRAVGLGRSVSSVCQDALERMVEIAEARMRARSGREDLIARLRAERRQFSSEDFQTGRVGGLTAASTLEYRDFRQLEKLWQQRDEIILRDGSWLQFSTLTYYWDDDAKATQLEEDLLQLEDSDEIALANRYLAGWLEGVMEVWQDIVGDVENWPEKGLEMELGQPK